jgi:hypothetical protein
LRKQPGAGFAASDALHFIDGQEFARVEAIRVELGATIEMAGDDEKIAADAGTACRGQPIGAATLNQLDELEFARRQIAAEDFFFVRQVDGDRANRLLVSMDFVVTDGNKNAASTAFADAGSDDGR